MIRAIQILRGPLEDETPEVPVYTPPGSEEAQRQAQAALDEEARRTRLRTVGGIALLGVVVVGAGALLFLTKEPGSVRYRKQKPRPGKRYCKSGYRYQVQKSGRDKIVGYC